MGTIASNERTTTKSSLTKRSRNSTKCEDLSTKLAGPTSKCNSCYVTRQVLITNYYRWECDWNRIRKHNPAISAFIDEYLTLPGEKINKLTEEELVDRILDGTLYGCGVATMKVIVMSVKLHGFRTVQKIISRFQNTCAKPTLTSSVHSSQNAKSRTRISGRICNSSRPSTSDPPRQQRR